LEHGARIYVLKVDRATHGIDTPQQYAAFVKRWQGQGARGKGQA
jgi:CMP-2-keto-3-deoxyoctulosonic acid synthetase